MSDAKFIVWLILLVLLFIIFLTLIGFGNYEVESRVSCPHFGRDINRPYRYDFWGGGCFVLTAEGQWVPAKNYWNSPVQQK